MMPESHNIMENIPQPVLGPDDTYRECTGREIYEEHSITGLNRSPVEILTAFITAESKIAGSGKSIWPEIPLAKVCEYVLIDGSFALRVVSEKEMQKDAKLDEPYEFLLDCIEIHRRLVTQESRDKDGQKNGLTRVWQQTNTDWVVRDVQNYGKTNEKVRATNRYPLDAFYPYPYGQGLLFPNQKTYRRLEEIESSIRQQTGPASLSLIVTGYAGDWKKASDTFSRGARIIGIPGHADVHRVAANTTTQDLVQDRDGLITFYSQNMHLIQISETSAMSGRARKLAMMPMLNYVNMIRTILDEVYALLGYTVDWGGLDVADPAELTAQLDFIERGKSGGYISIQEGQSMGRALFGLTGEPVGDIEEAIEPEPLIEEPIDSDTGETP